MTVGHLERVRVESEDTLGGLQPCRRSTPNRGHRRCSSCGRGRGDDRPDRDERRLVGDLLGLFDRGFDSGTTFSPPSTIWNVPPVMPRSAQGCSSVSAMLVLCSIEISLLSQNTIRLPSCWVPARDEASLVTPSSMFRRTRSHRCGDRTGWCPRGHPDRTVHAHSARPSPCRPRRPGPDRAGPVVISTPLVCRNSGGPASSNPTYAATRCRRVPTRNRPDRAADTGSGWNARRTGTNRSRPSQCTSLGSCRITRWNSV